MILDLLATDFFFNKIVPEAQFNAVSTQKSWKVGQFLARTPPLMLAFMPLPADPWLWSCTVPMVTVRAHGVNGCDQTSDSFLEKLHGYGYGHG